MQGFILNALLSTSGDVIADLERTTANWSHEVQFRVHMTFKKDAKISFFTYDLPWNYLDQGTSVRYARSNLDAKGNPLYRSKTTPGSLKSGKGAGKMLASRRPMRGIRPRGWSILVRDKHERTFNQRVVAAIVKGFIAG
jgi:hypothetical protein